MKVLYRSVSKIRRHGSYISWLSYSSNEAAHMFIQFTKTAGIASLLRILISFLFVLFFCPTIGLLLLISAIYKYAVQKLLDYFYFEEQLEIIWNTSLRGISDSCNKHGIITTLVLASGPSDIKIIQNRILNLIERSKRHSIYIKRLITTKFGCYAWKKLESEFKIGNHVLLSSEKWYRKLTNEKLLQKYLNELNSEVLPAEYPPWQIVVIPLSNTSYVLAIRLHHLVNNLVFKNLFKKSSKQIPYTIASSSISPTFRQQLISAFYTLKDLIKYFIEIPTFLMNEISNSTLKNNIFRKISGKKCISWTENLNLEFVKKMANRANVHTNDVLLFAIVGALRRYYNVMEGYTPENIFGTMVYYDPIKDSEFSPISLSLATVDINSRLRHLKNQTTFMKKTLSNAKITISILTYINWIFSDPLTKFFLNSITKKYSIIINNYQLSLYLNKNIWPDDIKMITSWEPIINIGISLSMTYTLKSISLSAVTDLNLIQHPDILLAYFIREINDFAVTLKVRTEKRSSPTIDN